MHFGCPSNSATNPNRPNRPIGQPDRRGPSTIRPTHRPIAPPRRAPHPAHPTLALGLRTLGAPGPPPGPSFPVFVFSRPPACSESPGPALTESTKTLRPERRTVRDARPTGGGGAVVPSSRARWPCGHRPSTSPTLGMLVGYLLAHLRVYNDETLTDGERIHTFFLSPPTHRTRGWFLSTHSRVACSSVGRNNVIAPPPPAVRAGGAGGLVLPGETAAHASETLAYSGICVRNGITRLGRRLRRRALLWPSVCVFLSSSSARCCPAVPEPLLEPSTWPGAVIIGVRALALAPYLEPRGVYFILVLSSRARRPRTSRKVRASHPAPALACA